MQRTSSKLAVLEQEHARVVSHSKVNERRLEDMIRGLYASNVELKRVHTDLAAQVPQLSENVEARDLEILGLRTARPDPSLAPYEEW